MTPQPKEFVIRNNGKNPLFLPVIEDGKKATLKIGGCELPPDQHRVKVSAATLEVLRKRRAFTGWEKSGTLETTPVWS